MGEDASSKLKSKLSTIEDSHLTDFKLSSMLVKLTSLTYCRTLKLYGAIKMSGD